MARDVGLDLPPDNALEAFAWCDARAERLLRAVAGDASTPCVLESEDRREYVDSDRGQDWPAGHHGKFYRLGSFECRPWYAWAREGALRESFSLTILKHEPTRFLVSVTLRGNVALPEGPGRFCAQRLTGSAAEFDAFLRVLHAASSA